MTFITSIESNTRGLYYLYWGMPMSWLTCCHCL